MEIKEGTVVYSKAGRDKGLMLVVLKTEPGYCYVADGELRRADKPKKKKLRHLQKTNYVSPSIEERLRSAQEVTNSQVRRALEEYRGFSIDSGDCD